MASTSGNDDTNINDDEADDSLSDHKLCGYLLAILSVTPPQSLAPLSRCSLSSGVAGFRSESGASLLPIPNSGADLDDTHSPSSSKRKRRRTGVVLVNGSRSVVHQMHALVSSRCMRVKGRVLRVSAREEGGDARAVLLVDVYLPLEAWSGWQFRRQGTLAASFFKHVRCDWEARNSMLVLDENSKASHHIGDERIWNCSDCHVFECMIHRTSGTFNTSLFDLHEIFKSLPTLEKDRMLNSTGIRPEVASSSSGIWDVADDVLAKILSTFGPNDLIRVSATCRHLRALAESILPCMKLRLYPHQQSAVEWMLKREHHSEVLLHPLFMSFSTEDGFSLYIDAVTGEISNGIAPTINDFRGGMFCDEPGLGKTITALSLILKTHRTLAEPPYGVDVVWCTHDSGRRCGYYEVSADNISSNFITTPKRVIGQTLDRLKVSSNKSPLESSSIGALEFYSERQSRRMASGSKSMDSEPCSAAKSSDSSCKSAILMPATRVLRCTRSTSRIKINLLNKYEEDERCEGNGKAADIKFDSEEVNAILDISNNSYKKQRKDDTGSSELETWVQCDACSKWRRLCSSTIDANAAWFCRMNADTLHQSCTKPEERWNYKQKITYLPGFYTKGTPQGVEKNISFFTSVLKKHSTLLNSETMRALTWLANLSDKQLLEMETVGLRRPAVLDAHMLLDEDTPGYHQIFQAFGLVRKVKRGTSRWFYPSILVSLAFDVSALKIALTKPLDLFKFYLSAATLIVVPTNLVDHWRTQILKHVSPGHLRVYVWTDNKKPFAHNLAWDYDIVITTFSRLSAEWGLRKRSTLMQVHWFRVMLDEGHTLGSSLSLTNKLQMAISLVATNRWILTGTPTPNTPTSQVSHLQPMLKFLHEEAYGQNQESWEVGILRPFEALMEEGRSRLLLLLQRIMISARKADLRSIPACKKKLTYLHFNEEHAKSYNELVVTVRRNILMADWNDPSHVESLLNPKQWKFRSNTIRNVRLSCCVAGHIKVTDAGQDIQETMDILVQQGLDPFSEEYVFIRYSLLHGCSCFRCKDWCRLPVITPCRHLLCLDCVSLDSEKCTYPGCGNPYMMQSPEKLARPENPNPKWPVPKDLIELQPSYEQDDWNPDWQSTKSSKVAYLVDRLKELREFDRKNHHAESINCRKILCPHIQGSKTTPNGMPCEMMPEKVIIFSQFLEHIHVTEQQLTLAGIKYAGMYNPMPLNNKMKSLHLFQYDDSCMVLLMDGSAALGLDLSFVAHVFLMEPLWDRSMEEQVISRAHRMGATRPIHVETLAMRGTIEEQMLEFLQDSRSRRVLQEEADINHEGARAHRTLHDFAENNYLSQLTFVRTNAKA